MRARSVLTPPCRTVVLAAVCSLFAATLNSCKKRQYNDGSVKNSVTTGTGKVTNGFLHDPADASCGGFPRLHVETMAKTCLGLAYADPDKKFTPRVIHPLPGPAGDTFLVSDFANWSTNNGKLWHMKVDKSGGQWKAKMTLIVEKLSAPHQITNGPENWIYFSEDDAIHRVAPKDIEAAVASGGKLTFQSENPAGQIRTILTGLPPMYYGTTKNSMHPLKHFVFDKAGNLYLNVGAYTDHCDTQASKPSAAKGCLELDTKPDRGLTPPVTSDADVRLHGAVIRVYRFSGSVATGWDAKGYAIVAQGLRNSMGLAFTDAGDLLQAENGRDFKESDRPYEELNLISKATIDAVLKGQDDAKAKNNASFFAKPPHYGWPYCYDYDSAADDWKVAGFDCKPGGANGYVPPLAFLPPHSAPLGLLRYKGSALKDLNPSGSGSLIVPLHGYRPAGQRILVFQIDGSGKPLKPAAPGGGFNETAAAGITYVPYKSTPSTVPSGELIKGWFDSPGVRPKGAPVAVAEGADGSIWMVDDKNSAILRLAPFDGVPFNEANRPDYGTPYTQYVGTRPSLKNKYDTLVKEVLDSPQCEGCHDTYKDVKDLAGDGFEQLRYVLGMGTWVNLQLEPGKRAAASTLYTKLLPGGSMPPLDRAAWPGGDPAPALKKVATFIDALPNPKSLYRAKVDTAVTGTNPGVPGNGACGNISAGRVVSARQSARLGGVDVIEVVVEDGAGLVGDASCLQDWKAFWAKQADFEPLFPK
ncbi:MAG: hypothetical protein IOD12_06775 [Silvanigrellales bacterium]|jgi:glucose/arabinose dehydrogenase|nr:hypothetical protein [Silvanigrellales bacterium]